MTDLTEQWKKGKLPSRDDDHLWLAYYIRHKDGYIHADSLWRGHWGVADRNSIKEILSPVPSYEEWQQLKDMLYKCREKLDRLDYGCEVWARELTGFIEEIDNVLGEKK